MPSLTSTSLEKHELQREKELHSGLKRLNIDFERFYGIKPSKVDRRFVITLSDLTYLPKVSNQYFFFIVYQYPSSALQPTKKPTSLRPMVSKSAIILGLTKDVTD